MFSFSDNSFQSFEEPLFYPPERFGFVLRGGTGHDHPMHRHRELEFNFVRAGTARYLLGDRRYDLRAGSLVWLFPKQDHVLLDRSPDYRMWIVVVSPALVTAACRSEIAAPLTEPAPAGSFCRRIKPLAVARLESLLSEIAALPPPEYDTFNAGLAYALCMAWGAYRDAGSVGDSGARVHAAVETAVSLLRKPDDDRSLAQIARACGISADHLTRLFTRQIGIAPLAFRNRERIRFFVTQADKYDNLTTAALAAGFGSYAQFHRVFRQEMGISPHQWKPMR